MIWSNTAFALYTHLDSSDPGRELEAARRRESIAEAFAARRDLATMEPCPDEPRTPRGRGLPVAIGLLLARRRPARAARG